MRLYKLLKDLPTVKAGAIFKEKIKIDGTRVLKACESDIDIQFLLEKSIILTSGSNQQTVSIGSLNGVIHIGTLTIGAKLAFAITRTLSLTD